MYRLIKKWIDNIVRGASSRLGGLGYETKTEVIPALAPYSPTLPRNYTSLPAGLQAYYQETIELASVSLYTLKNIYVSWYATAFKNLQVFMPAMAIQVISPHLDFYNDSLLLTQWLSRRVQKIPYSLALVHDQWTTINYYHWMADSLPRLVVLRKHHPGCPLLMPMPIANYVRVTCAALGFHNLVELNQKEVARVLELLVPAHVAPLGYQHPALLQVAAEAVVSAVVSEANKVVPTKRIYVSRAKQKLRRLTNEEAIIPLLVKYGFQTVFFEEMSFEQQVTLMQETTVLIGVHGANLTNLLFLPAMAKVVELINQDKMELIRPVNFEDLIYFRLATGQQLVYYSLLCKNASADGITNDSDMHIDPAALEAVLQDL